MSAKPDRNVQRFFGGRDVAGVRETTEFLRDQFEHAVSIRTVRELALEFDADVLDEKTVAISRTVFYAVLAELDVQVEGVESDDGYEDA